MTVLAVWDSWDGSCSVGQLQRSLQRGTVETVLPVRDNWSGPSSVGSCGCPCSVGQLGRSLQRGTVGAVLGGGGPYGVQQAKLPVGGWKQACLRSLTQLLSARCFIAASTSPDFDR